MELFVRLLEIPCLCRLSASNEFVKMATKDADDKSGPILGALRGMGC
jgi:hypothetical protein